MVRLRYKLIIPANFIDIKNPPEKKLIEIAAQRGVFLSIHHIETLGVSAFTFFNYWKERDKDYKFSYYSNPEELKIIWNEYPKKWAQYDNVVWQIGLRGIADRPMWEADEDIPQSVGDRGNLISDAMADQVEILKKVGKRKNIQITTTHWMEGSDLNQDGYLSFPENIMEIFSIICFDPELILDDWCRENFSGSQKKAEAAYRQFFNSYQMHDKINAPILLDFQIRRKGLGLLGALIKGLEEPENFSKVSGKTNNGEDLAWANQYLKDSRTVNMTLKNELRKSGFKRRILERQISL